jgi:uracil-DNA glycosylase family 4
VSDSVRFIPGKGNPRAAIMLVGEAPGEQESVQGLPFVGSSGKLLEEALAKVGWDRANIYVTNVVKVRPLNNRTPTLEEIQSWMPLLLEEMEQINPMLVITLGATAARVFDDTIKITRDHGSTECIEVGQSKYWVACTFHPSYVLRGSLHKDDWFKDFQRIKMDNGVA